MSGLCQEEAGGERNGSLQTASAVGRRYGAVGAPRRREVRRGGAVAGTVSGQPADFTGRVRHATTASEPSSVVGHLGLPAVPTYVPSVSRINHFQSLFLVPSVMTELFINLLPEWIRPGASGTGSGGAHPARPHLARLLSRCPSRVGLPALPWTPSATSAPSLFSGGGAGCVVTAQAGASLPACLWVVARLGNRSAYLRNGARLPVLLQRRARCVAGLASLAGHPQCRAGRPSVCCMLASLLLLFIF